MTSVMQLRKEKEMLLGHIQRYEHYISALDSRLHSEEGRKLYESHVKRFTDYIRKSRERIAKIDAQMMGRSALLISAIVIMIASSFFIFMYPDITGNIVFSIVESESREVNWTFAQQGTRKFEYAGFLTTLAVSGEYHGEGPLRIYLLLPEGKKLIFAAENATSFRDECGSVCYLSLDEKKYDIEVSMPEGAYLQISRLSFAKAELSEFSIDPKEADFALEGNRLIKGKFTITNSRETEVYLALYAEGELTDYTTLSASSARLSPNSSVDIRYDIDLPLQAKAGEYGEKIIVRYLPESEFTGPAPLEAHSISATIKGRQLSPKTNILYILAGILILNLIFFGRNIFKSHK